MSGQRAVHALGREGIWQRLLGAGRRCCRRVALNQRERAVRRRAMARVIRAHGQQRAPFHFPPRRAFTFVTRGNGRLPCHRGTVGAATCRLRLDCRCRALHLAVAGHGWATHAARGARELEEPALLHRNTCDALGWRGMGLGPEGAQALGRGEWAGDGEWTGRGGADACRHRDTHAHTPEWIGMGLGLEGATARRMEYWGGWVRDRDWRGRVDGYRMGAGRGNRTQPLAQAQLDGRAQ